MKNLFKWSCRRRKDEPDPAPVEIVPLTRREKAKVLSHMTILDTSDAEKQMLAIVSDYAAGTPIPIIASRRHCSETTVNRRINEAIQRWYDDMK